MGERRRLSPTKINNSISHPARTAMADQSSLATPTPTVVRHQHQRHYNQLEPEHNEMRKLNRGFQSQQHGKRQLAPVQEGCKHNKLNRLTRLISLLPLAFNH
jgi:hypothetical protein